MNVMNLEQHEEVFELTKNIINKTQTSNLRKHPGSNMVHTIRSEAFDFFAVLMGEYFGNLGFVGKIWLRSKVKNISNCSYKKPISLFLTTKECQVSENNIGRRCPDKGVVLISDLALNVWKKTWKPGEEIVLTREIGIETNNSQDNEWKFFEYLTKSLKLPTNEPIKIDKYVSTFCDMSFSTQLDCF